jgi:hypothetical protein
VKVDADESIGIIDWLLVIDGWLIGYRLWMDGDWITLLLG